MTFVKYNQLTSYYLYNFYRFFLPTRPVVLKRPMSLMVNCVILVDSGIPIRSMIFLLDLMSREENE